jgi:DNA-binding NarL/FixJ family response regulator
MAGDPKTAETLEQEAKAAYLELAFDRSIECWERAYAAYREAENGVGAIRAARMLSYMNATIVGDGAVTQGWLARSQTLLTDAEDTVERGWVALNRGLFEGDDARRRELFHEAIDVARAHRDRNLEFGALAYLGAALVHRDETEQGMTLLDEACAAVAGGEVDDFQVLQEIFCQLFSACEHAHDVNRAEQWSRIAEDVAERRNLPAVSAFCRTHYGALLTAAGRWDEADVTLTEAVRLWALGHRAIRWQALIRLADLRVRQGRFEEAEQLLEGLDAYPEAARPVAAVRIARGETAVAADVLERALAQMDPDSASAAPLWALLADVRLVRQETDRAVEAVEHLDAIAQRHPSDYLLALDALHRGRLCMVSGAGDPRACLRDALAGFARAGMPMELARSRLELANATWTDQPEVALAEATAALEAFERLQAARDADAAAALLRRLGGPARTGPKGGGTLTKREGEVLELLGFGLSNPEISDRLFISRKTVEHHVTNVLAKLGLRSRAEAAAYASRLDQGQR